MVLGHSTAETLCLEGNAEKSLGVWPEFWHLDVMTNQSHYKARLLNQGVTLAKNTGLWPFY